MFAPAHAKNHREAVQAGRQVIRGVMKIMRRAARYPAPGSQEQISARETEDNCGKLEHKKWLKLCLQVRQQYSGCHLLALIE